MEADGMLMRGRHESEVGAHCKEENMNYQSLGLCLTGNFDVEEPTKKQLNTLRELITYLRNKYDISRQNVKFHRDFATYKTCPGRLFTNKILNKCMSMRELKRDKKGGFWFIKSGDKGKQKVNSIGGVLTVLSREFGVDTIDDTYLEELQDKKYFN
jgi:N-acetyl-anhydromuramyl-L-alanine amidase AmpD